jgi:hypothetical protein
MWKATPPAWGTDPMSVVGSTAHSSVFAIAKTVAFPDLDKVDASEKTRQKNRQVW